MRLVLPLLGLALMGVLRAAPVPESVAVLFNTSDSESRKLAVYYCEQRKIPAENLIGLPMPERPDITHEQYVEKIRDPLREQFDRRGWWRRSKQADGNLIPVANEIRILVCCKGVPLRIKRTRPEPGDGAAAKEKNNRNPFEGRDEAAVDSELALFGVDGLPTEGALDNKYFKASKPVASMNMPFQLLTARIDASSYEICRRMIADAVAAEQTGLLGMAYVDIAKKFPQGDTWLESIASQNRVYGIPTVVDSFKETLPQNYPMTNASLYYGWYNWHLDGPFLNPKFRFSPGAIAIHIHSFSAVQLTDPKKNWCAGLLAKGAAVTVGNVYEPYLGNSHHLDLMHQRLLEGKSWVEACWMAMPVCSWQAIVLGDPLYVPFVHLKGTGKIVKEQKPFRALRAAMLRWPGGERERHKQLEMAASRTKKGVFWEAIGLEQVAREKNADAMFAFQQASKLYTSPPDRLRQTMHRVANDRVAKRDKLAAAELQKAVDEYSGIPESMAPKAWLKTLQTPPKKPSQPKPDTPREGG